jgi:hypothetical protein
MGAHIWNYKVCVNLVQELTCWITNSAMIAVRGTYRLKIFSCVLGEESLTVLEDLLYLHLTIMSTFLLAHRIEARHWIRNSAVSAI